MPDSTCASASNSEITDYVARTRILKEFITYIAAFTPLGLAGLKVYNLWADPSDEDVQRALANRTEGNVRTCAMLTERLDPTNEFSRGGRSVDVTHRKLFPPADIMEAIGGTVENLTLLSVGGTPGSIILRFNKCYCQVRECSLGTELPISLLSTNVKNFVRKID